MDIRKTVTLIEDTLIEGRNQLPQPQRRIATIAVIRNPAAGTNSEGLNELVQDGGDLGRFLAERALEHIDQSRISLVGKGAIVGADGEPEQGQAILYPKFATAVRDALQLGPVHIAGEKKLAKAGAPLEILLWRIQGGSSEPAGQLEIRVPGSPQNDEILVALVVAGAR
ncbi:MAG TPA: amino acid synthesis family protein [Chloroflexota bacterium]|nr:amino acid synthesis family protein [Chloroflexota bacterium]